MVYQNLIILITYIYTVLLECCMWYMGPNKVAIIIPPILQSFHFREMPPSFFSHHIQLQFSQLYFWQRVPTPAC